MDLLLIDNSNIFITLKQKYNDDLSVRFDYDKFQKIYLNESKLQKVLVGSTPPKSDNFWKVMENKGFEVYTYERTKSGEKGVDGKIIARGSRFIHEYGYKNATLHLLSGDLDFLALIEEANEFQVSVILWAWKSSLNSRYLDDAMTSLITVKYLDDIEDEIIFFEYEKDGKKVSETLFQRKEKLKKEQEIRLERENQIKLDRIIQSEQDARKHSIKLERKRQIELEKMKFEQEVAIERERRREEEKKQQQYQQKIEENLKLRIEEQGKESNNLGWKVAAGVGALIALAAAILK